MSEEIKNKNPMTPIDLDNPFGFSVSEEFIEKTKELQGEQNSLLTEEDDDLTIKSKKAWGKPEESVDLEEEEEVKKIVPKERKKEDSVKKQAESYDEVYKEILNRFGIKAEEDFEFNDDNVLNAISDNYLERIKDQYFDGVPQEAFEIVEYLRNGGSINDYLEIINNNDLSEIELEDNVSNQRKLVTEYYKATTNLPLDKIKSKIQKLEERGLLEEEALSAKEDWDEIQNNRKEQVLQEQANLKKQQDERMQEFRKTISNKITTSKEIKGLPISLSPKERKELEDYILKPNVRLQDGRVVSQNIADMINEQDEDTFILQALLRKSSYKLVSGIKNTLSKDTKVSLAERLRNAQKDNARIKSSIDSIEDIDLEDDEFVKKNSNKLWK
jgi:hypothetical protein